MSEYPHAVPAIGKARRSDDGMIVRRRMRRAEDVLDHSQRELFRALKLSRGFERQKLGRRQKTANTGGESLNDASRLAAEVNALKQLDLSRTAEIHLYKSLLKIPAVRNSPALPPRVKFSLTNASPSEGRTVENVRARLLNSNPVKITYDHCLVAMCSALHVPKEAAKKRKRLRSTDYDIVLHNATTKTTEDESDHPNSSSEESWRGFSPASTAGSPRNEVIQDVAKCDASNIVPDISQLDNASWHSDPARGEGELSDSDSVRLSLRTLTSSKGSTPSLTLADFHPPFLANGYVSGSSDAESVSSGDTKPRRNRRGQQERRAIWEKKFGRNAKHVKRHESSRDHGWDAKKGALGSSERDGQPHDRSQRRKSYGPTHVGEANRRSRAKTVTRSDNRTTTSDAPLHPSWEAARRAKEKKESRIFPFQGKRVVFD